MMSETICQEWLGDLWLDKVRGDKLLLMITSFTLSRFQREDLGRKLGHRVLIGQRLSR